MKPSATSLQHARVWSAAKLLLQRIAIVAHFLSSCTRVKRRGGVCLREISCETTIISPAVRYLASLFTRDSIFIYVAACNSNEKLVYKRGGAQPGGMYQSLLSALKVEFNLMIKRQLSNLQI